MTWLINLLGGNLISGVGSIVKTIFGSRQERDKQNYDLNVATLNEFASEFTERKNWFDSLIDAINRLPRPVMALGIIALFVWCVVDPAAFAVSMQALGLIPEAMWYILGAIVTFFFGDRTLQGVMKTKGPSTEQVRAVFESQNAIRAIADPKPEVTSNAQSATLTPQPPLSEAEYQKEMASPKPLSDAAIQEWNRRNNPNYRNPSIEAWRKRKP